MIRNHKTLVWIMIILYTTNAMEVQSTKQIAPIDPDEAPEMVNVRIHENDIVIQDTNDDESYTYNTENYIGRGGFGKVYLGFDKKNKQVAIKKIESDDYHVFMTEVNIMKKLKHNNILKLLYYTPLNKRQKYYYIVTEHCAGGELLDALKVKGHFSEQTAKIYFQQILDGLLYMHQRDIMIMHRDLKLENILLEKDQDEDSNNIKIIDFGLSYDCLKNQGGDIHTGTFQYRAPEEFSKRWNEKNLCAQKQVDVWSLGVVLHIMLFGTPPYKRIAKGPKVGNISFLEQPFNWHNVSHEVKHLLGLMLKEDPEKRIKLTSILNHPWIQCREKGNYKCLLENKNVQGKQKL